MQECPSGNGIRGFAPEDREIVSASSSSFYRSCLRTGRYYTYKIYATIDLTSLGKPYIVSDTGPTVAFQIILCISGVSGFCSPFIHEEANERIIRNQGGNETLPQVLTGERHGQTHVHSPKVFRNLTFEDGPIYELEVDVPVLVNEPADFYAIAAVQFFLGDTPTDIETRYDMANALIEGERLLTYQAPADILDVPPSVLILCNIFRGIVAVAISFFLVEAFKHRNHQVLRLSQYPFLVVFLLAALVATIFTFLLEPRNDFYCRWGKLIVVSALQLVLAVTAGRMWRIGSVISPLLVKTLRQQESCERRFIRSLLRRPKGQSFRNIRREFQPWHLTVFIAALTVPQVLLQLAAALWQNEMLEIDYNFDKSTGRHICSCEDIDFSRSISFYGYCLFVLLIFSVLVMAHMTRHLPSLFNETEVIFNTALSSLLVLALGAAVVIVTDDPTTSPAINYLTWCFLVFTITLNATFRIMLPKLTMIWRGETVLVSKLVAEHAKSAREDDEVYLSKNDNSRASSGVRVTGMALNASHKKREESDSRDLARAVQDFEATSIADGASTDRGSEAVVSESQENNSGVEPCDSHETAAEGLVQKQSHPSPPTRRVTFSEHQVEALPNNERPTLQGNRQKSSKIEHILIRHDETPSKRLILKMYNLQAHLAEVNQRVMSGRSVPKREWEKLRRMSTRLGDTFHAVSFDWDTAESAELSGSVDIALEGDQEGFPDEEHPGRVHI